MSAKIREHAHFLIVTAVLTVAMTWPTVTYVLRTDVNWLPGARHEDVYLSLWRVWYGEKVLTGQADRFHTDLIYYPDGVSLAYTQMSFPYIVASLALRAFMPVFNAYSIGYLLIVITTALAAYIYLGWLFKEKWLALFGASLFAFCPQVVGLPVWPDISWIAPTPLVLYCVHRGVCEGRSSLILLGGLGAGLMTAVVMYQFVTILIALGLLVCALAASRWRDREFWWRMMLLAVAIALACSWRVIPMMQDQGQTDRARVFASDNSQSGDLISFFINRRNPIFGSFAEAIVDAMPDNNKPLKRGYLGYVPLVLLGIGLLNQRSRRRMLPWLGLLLVFLVLSLGSALKVNGVVYQDIRLPKHLLEQLLPFIFGAFRLHDHLSFFLLGAWLPLAILACYGLLALRERFAFAARPAFILLLIALSAFERHIPVYHPPKVWWSKSVSEARLAYLDWLKGEEGEDIALVNLPFGWAFGAFYVYAQTLSGYPIVEGTTNRTLDSAYAYVRANYILNAWHSLRPIRCEYADREAYLAAVDSLEADGFSHVIDHRILFQSPLTADSFTGLQASYSDDYVSIYRLEDLRASCPKEPSTVQLFASAYVEALGKGGLLDQQRRAAVVLPPTEEMGERFMGYLRHAGWKDPTVVAVSAGADAEIDIRSTAPVDLEAQSAVWLLRDRLEFNPERTAPNFGWFLARFKFCERFYEDESTTIDLYLQQDIPCAAMDTSSAFEVRYAGGVRLHNAYLEVDSKQARLYLAWTRETEQKYSFSIQFIGEDGKKAMQMDNVIRRSLLTAYDIDTSLLPKGAYTVRLIVYDFETKASQSGVLVDGSHRFERELEIARIEI